MRWTNRIEICVIAVLITSTWYAPSAGQSVGLSVPVAPLEPIIDGVLEPLWMAADSTSEFIQLQPNEGERCSEQTWAYVMQDTTAIYFAFRCRINNRYPDCRQGTRDSREGDGVCVFLDTYCDARNAYYFAVNCSGVQADGILSDDGHSDNLTWDGIFRSGVSVDTDGYCVELAIPWTTLRFDGSRNEWGINIERDIPKNGEKAYFATVKQNEGMRLSKFATLNSVAPVEPTFGIELYPHLFYRTERSYGETSETVRPALDLNYNPGSLLRLQLTVRPDFSQIEADHFAVNLSRYALYFDEKRPFFVEGMEFFQPPGGAMAQMMELFYSRQVGRKLSDGSEVPLDAGGRATVRSGRLVAGTFIASTGQKEYLGYLGPDVEERATFTANRIAWQLLPNVVVGGAYAGKFTSSVTNSVYSGDVSVTAPTFQAALQLAGSRYDQIDGAAFKGYMFYAPRSFSVTGTAMIVGDNFNVSEIGYVPWKGYHAYAISAGPIIYPSSGPLTFGSLSLNISTDREFAEPDYSHDFGISAAAALRNGWGASLDVTIGRDYEQGGWLNPKALSAYLRTDISRRFWAYASYYSVLQYNYSRGYIGRTDYITWYSAFRPAGSLSLFAGSSAWIEHRPGGDIEDITTTIRPGMDINLAEGLNIRIYGETPFSRNDGLKSFRLGVSVSYNFLPKSWLYVAYNEYQYRLDGRFYHAEQVVALKLRYLLSI